jgi:hypothetical protein
LGYCIGNEIFDDVANNPQFWTNFGALVDRADRAGVSMNCKPFLMTAITDNYTPETSWPAIKEGEKSGKLSKLDAWGVNVYRGPKIGGEGNSPFTQYKALMTTLKRSKPFILAEWGTPHSRVRKGLTDTLAAAYCRSIWMRFLKAKWAKENHTLTPRRQQNS